MTETVYWSGWPFTVLGKRPESGLKLRYYLNRQKRHRLQQHVMEVVLEHAPGLAYGEKGTEVSEETINVILKAIEDKQAGYSLKHARNFFVQGIDRGNKQGLWSINTPAPVMTIRRKPALFQPDNFNRLPRIRIVQKAFQKTLTDANFFSSADLYLERLEGKPRLKSKPTAKQLRGGQILLSALLYGGLVDLKSLRLLPSHAALCQVTKDLYWIDLMANVTIRLEPGEERTATEKRMSLRPEKSLLRRWFPDAITELLLLRWQSDQLGAFPLLDGMNCESEDYCSYLIRQFLMSLDIENSKSPIKLSELVQGAVTLNALRLPSFLVAYAQNKYDTSSLPAPAWYRLHSGFRGEVTNVELLSPEPDTFQANLTATPLFQDSVSIARFDQYALYKNLIKSLSISRSEKIKPHSQAISLVEQFLEGHQGQIAPPLFRLCQWAIEMYRNGSHIKARLAASTIPKYLGQVQDIIHHLGTDDPLQCETEELVEVYQTLINQAKSDKARFYRLGRIREFQLFLTKLGYPEKLNLSDLSGGGRSSAEVDANYLNEVEFQQSLNELNRIETFNPRLTRVRRLVLILGYRCGLRRTEAWKLRIRDIQGTHAPMLYVLGTTHKTVKSTNSIRQLPLKSLLNAKELEELMTWSRQRHLEEGLADSMTNNAFLFSHEGNGNGLIKEALIFPVLHTVLRAVTGDSSIRYHHLRHSFANNQLMRCMQINFPAASRRLAESVDILNKPADNSLFALAPIHLTRKHLFQVSNLLGHGSPDMTLKHYIHLCDWMLMQTLNSHKDSELPIETVSIISGLTRANLIKSRQRNFSEDTIVNVARAKMRFNILNSSATRLAVKNTIAQNTPIEWPASLINPLAAKLREEPPIALLHQVIEHYDSMDKDANYWSKKIGYSIFIIQHWIIAANQLAGMKTRKGAYRHIKPQWWSIGDETKKKLLQQNQLTRPSHCMSKPHNAQDIEDANNAITRLSRLRIDDPDLAQWGINYYIRYNVASRSHLRMISAESAKKFSEFIQCLGFPKSRINCRLKPQTKTGVESVNVQIKFWQDLLSISASQIELKTPLEKRGASIGTLSMMLSYRLENGEIQASYGFRYALYMMGVLMLASGEVILDEFC
ncbi:site-specific recombinase XerD [Methylobacter tundripaludum]|uniref:Site-specific recombinase XerD n=1 Tax=Methylobacter tundripaludum TaxID=173365 RepID=A0A2S6H8T6_9GAMM|nr:site-specific integrase [Methylobacter tundripaludum]PPK73894.1 site-specific recombinase XerD [Methylobacter tundripaludum]